MQKDQKHKQNYKINKKDPKHTKNTKKITNISFFSFLFHLDGFHNIYLQDRGLEMLVVHERILKCPKNKVTTSTQPHNQ